MKWQWQTPDVPSVVIALSAMLLGGMVAIRFMPSTLVNGNRSYPFGVSSLSITSICAVSLIILVGLVILKSLEDRRSRIERDLLETFLENIPDNVYFKDLQSRFLRISRAMAGYLGLADPAQAVNKTD